MSHPLKMNGWNPKSWSNEGGWFRWFSFSNRWWNQVNHDSFFFLQGAIQGQETSPCCQIVPYFSHRKKPSELHGALWGVMMFFFEFEVNFFTKKMISGGHFHRDKIPKRGFESRFPGSVLDPLSIWAIYKRPGTHIVTPNWWWVLVREFGPQKMARNTPVKALFFELPRYKLRYMNYKKGNASQFPNGSLFFLASQPFFNMKTEFMADEFRNFSFHGQTSKVSVWKPEKSKMLRISHPSISTQNRGGKPIFVHPKQMVWKSKVQWRKQSKQGWIFVTFHLGPLWGVGRFEGLIRWNFSTCCQWRC